MFFVRKSLIMVPCSERDEEASFRPKGETSRETLCVRQPVSVFEIPSRLSNSIRLERHALAAKDWRLYVQIEPAYTVKPLGYADGKGALGRQESGCETD